MLRLCCKHIAILNILSFSCLITTLKKINITYFMLSRSRVYYSTILVHAKQFNNKTPHYDKRHSSSECVLSFVWFQWQFEWNNLNRKDYSRVGKDICTFCNINKEKKTKETIKNVPSGGGTAKGSYLAYIGVTWKTILQLWKETIRLHFIPLNPFCIDIPLFRILLLFRPSKTHPLPILLTLLAR